MRMSGGHPLYKNEPFIFYMKRIFLFFAAIFAAMTVSGQDLSQLPQLPNDPAVRKGQLENGLTYYIRHNDKPAERAEFYLATNVGAIQETLTRTDLHIFWSTCASTAPRISLTRASLNISRE